MKLKKKAAAAGAVIAALTAAVGTAAYPAYAEWLNYGVMGDLNGDKQINISDLVLLSEHLLAKSSLSLSNGYKTDGKPVSVNGGDYFYSDEYFITADVNQDKRVDSFDLVLLRQHIVRGYGDIVWLWEEDGQTTTTTTTTAAATTTASTVTTSVTTATTSVPDSSFIPAPLYDQYGSLPSQDEAELLVFYVDFPDCKYDYEPSEAEIEKIAFGSENTSDPNYPFDSMSAFYDRSSKGAIDLQGKAYRYTTKNNKSTYENDAWHVALIDEIMQSYAGTIDFSKFDGDNDKIIDSILISVPTKAGDDDWWPAAGGYGGNNNSVSNGMTLGHVIVGNAQIEPSTDHKNFVSSYLHEMGHCMGLPDYYLYSGYSDNNPFGLNGSAGYELMDDAICDFGALSKLMLGWYTSDQIQVYDSSAGTQTFTLNNAQKGESNCVIIPNGSLADKYRSEFFIIEFATLDGNNGQVSSYWWKQPAAEGVRVYHAEATNNGNRWYNYWKYASGEDEATNTNAGRRFIRLVGESSDHSDNTDNFYRTGSVISSSTSGFQWYDSNGGQTVDPGVKITVGERSGDSYTITISAN